VLLLVLSRRELRGQRRRLHLVRRTVVYRPSYAVCQRVARDAGVQPPRPSAIQNSFVARRVRLRHGSRGCAGDSPAYRWAGRCASRDRRSDRGLRQQRGIGGEKPPILGVSTRLDFSARAAPGMLRLRSITNDNPKAHHQSHTTSVDTSTGSMRESTPNFRAHLCYRRRITVRTLSRSWGSGTTVMTIRSAHASRTSFSISRSRLS
jgi:hypothetical protein